MSFDFPRRASRFVLLAGCLSLGLATQSVAAQSAKTTSRAEPAQKCANDLRAFDGELRKGGCWLHNSGYGYGYPLYGYPISAAQPVSADTTSLRSDQLIGTDVVSPRDESLGTVDDIVLSPQAGKIAYLVVRYGGFLGVDAKYVPVPWEDFKITSGATLMVLDFNKNVLDSGPQVRENQFSANGNFAEQSRKVDDYWKAHLSQ
jgi:sporulation protein YlmC with PRC-barrel domain